MAAGRSLLLAVALWLTGCQPTAVVVTNDQAMQVAPACSDPHTLIGTIQDHSDVSPLVGQRVTARGIVTRQLTAHSFFLQEPVASADGDPRTSDALLVVLLPTAQLAGAVPGSELIVSGLVIEQAQQPAAASGSVTLLSQALATVCNHAQPLPIVLIDQLVDDIALEHMHVALSDWQVAAPMRRSTNDDSAVSSGTLHVASQNLYQPTQVVLPGTAAQQLALRNRAHSLQLQVRGVAAEQAWQMRAGDRLSVSGILQPQPELGQLIELADFELGASALVQPVPAQQDLTMRVVGLNMQNLFNGDGQGGAFPTPRGAASAAQYQLQLDQLVDAIGQLQPHVLALQELENDGFDQYSSIAQLTQELNNKLQQAWAFVQPPAAEMLGSDAISVGLLYRQDLLRAVEPAATLRTAPFDQLSRTPLVQRFRSLEGNLSFMVSVNHFKSKGGCQNADMHEDEAGNANQNDGQACWNAARLQSAQLLQQWLGDLQQQQNEDNILIIGDLNAYRMEQPIQALTRNGWIDLVSRFHSMPLYSYRYRGQIGTLDYALASPALLPRVANAWYWNVNADASARQLQRWQPGARFSDHDPVVVDLKLY